MTLALLSTGGGAWLDGARRFEWAFWAALGVLVATGVGLVASYGAALPGTDTRWGATLAVKLALVALVAAVSLVRTMHLVRLGLMTRGSPRVAPLRALYALTASLGLVVLVLAQLLAHG